MKFEFPKKEPKENKIMKTKSALRGYCTTYPQKLQN